MTFHPWEQERKPPSQLAASRRARDPSRPGSPRAGSQRNRQDERVLAARVRRVIARAQRDLPEAEAAVERLRALVARAHLEEHLVGAARLRHAHDLAQQRAAVAAALLR